MPRLLWIPFLVLLGACDGGSDPSDSPATQDPTDAPAGDLRYIRITDDTVSSDSPLPGLDVTGVMRYDGALEHFAEGVECTPVAGGAASHSSCADAVGERDRNLIANGCETTDSGFVNLGGDGGELIADMGTGAWAEGDILSIGNCNQDASTETPAATMEISTDGETWMPCSTGTELTCVITAEML